MELGIFGSSRNVEDLKEQVKVANDLGYATCWTPQSQTGPCVWSAPCRIRVTWSAWL